MRYLLTENLKKAVSIDDVLNITVDTISHIKGKNSKIKIGYVAGKVTSDGKDNILKNLKRLHAFTNKVSLKFGENIFSAADVFSEEIYWKINLHKPVHEREFYSFWRKIVKSGITDIFMTPEWESSNGAIDEHQTAKKIGIKIHYLA